GRDAEEPGCQRALLGSRERLSRLQGVGGGGECGSGLLVEQLAVGGERHTVRLPVQQLDAEFALQLRDRLRQRGLREMELLGGTRDLPFLDHRDEVEKLSSLEAHAPCPERRTGLEPATSSLGSLRSTN